MRAVDWRFAGVVMLALLAAPACAEVILTVSVRPPSFAQLGDQVTVTITTRDRQGELLVMEEVTLDRVGETSPLYGVTGVDGRQVFTVTHGEEGTTSYEYAARCGDVEQRVTIPVTGPAQPAPAPHGAALAFLLDSPGTEPSAKLLADPALMSATRQGLTDFAGGLRYASAFAAILGGPARALFVDTQGRRVGFAGGEIVNEIPDAEVIASDDMGQYYLPADRQYQLTIEGTDVGFGTLTLVTLDPKGLAIRVFEDIPLDAGSRASVPIAVGGGAQAVLTADGLVPPAVSGVIDPSSAAWTGEGTTTETPPVALAEGSVIDRAVFCTGEDADGQLVGVGTTFPIGTVKVGLYLHINNAPPGTELDITWLLDGSALRRQILEAEGSGSSLTYLMAANKPQLWEGDYAVTIKQNDQLIGTLEFAVR